MFSEQKMLPIIDRARRGMQNLPGYFLRQIERPPLIERELSYRIYLLLKGASYSPAHPDLSGVGETLEVKPLRTVSEYNAAVEEVRALGLCPHFHRIKTWDALSALKFILNNTGSKSSVLDAGGEIYSPLVEWLYLYGYKDLCVCNIDFENDFRRGTVDYRNADFVDQEFQEDTFDVVVSLSVIEHGLDIQTTLEEFYRIVKPGGYLIISTDYWPEKIDTQDKKTRYGEGVQEWNIFDREEVVDILDMANSIGFKTPDERELSVDEQTIEWKDKSYTFIYFELQA